MKKIWLFILGLFTIFLIWNITQARDYEYTNLDITASIVDDWTMSIKENYTANFFVNKHWIIRYIPLNYIVEWQQFHINVLNVYVGMFIISIIDFNENFRWNYGRQCRVNDTKSIRVKLPAVEIAPNKYEPDWQFMEDYIKSLPYSSCL